MFFFPICITVNHCLKNIVIVMAMRKREREREKESQTLNKKHMLLSYFSIRSNDLQN